jgi:hypothetical protein
MAADLNHDFILRSAGLMPGTAAYSEAAKKLKDQEKEKEKANRIINAGEPKGYNKLGIVGQPLERNTRMAQVLAALPAYSDMARAILASVSPIRAVGGSKQ